MWPRIPEKWIKAKMNGFKLVTKDPHSVFDENDDKDQVFHKDTNFANDTWKYKG